MGGMLLPTTWWSAGRVVVMVPTLLGVPNWERHPKSGIRASDGEKELAGVLSGEQLEERVGERLDAALDDVLVRLQLPAAEPLGELGGALGVAARVVEDDESLHRRARHQ